MRLTAQHDRPKVNIVSLLRRAVYNNGTYYPAGVLGRVMRVIPGRAIQVRDELIREALLRCDGTLRDAG
jgi:hypothetical protein